ncbi:class II aldolase/adducin family protein [Pseudomonas denitrificans (nom. rej.)]|nr:class II aldolase/adducin family protein [Pseudomonas denitrificans (nom. rej.)]
MSTTPIDPIALFQQFEQDVATSLRLLLDSQALRPGAAGNLSLRLPGQERLLIAAFNGDQPGSALALDFDLSNGHGTPSDNLREVAALHVAIYRERPRATAVIHTHSPFLSAFAIARRPLPAHTNALLFGIDEDQAIPVAEWGPRYASEPVVAALREHPWTPAVLLANHGPFAWTEGGVLAATRLLVNLEESAYLSFLAEQLGGARTFPAGAAKQVRQGWNNQ